MKCNYEQICEISSYLHLSFVLRFHQLVSDPCLWNIWRSIHFDWKSCVRGSEGFRFTFGCYIDMNRCCVGLQIGNIRPKILCDQNEILTIGWIAYVVPLKCKHSTISQKPYLRFSLTLNCLCNLCARINIVFIFIVRCWTFSDVQFSWLNIMLQSWNRSTQLHVQIHSSVKYRFVSIFRSPFPYHCKSLDSVRAIVQWREPLR